MKKLFVKIGEMKFGRSPDVLATMGLGSCVGVAIYDERKKVGALLHFLLPENVRGDSNLFKFGDTGIRETIRVLEGIGANRGILKAKIVGGALMFAQLLKNPENAIGKRNIEMAKKVLKEEGIKLVSDDTGGDYGRSMEFYLDSGEVKVSSYKMGEKVI